MDVHGTLRTWSSYIHPMSLLRYNFADDSDHCLAHVINEVRVDGGNVTIEWQATGEGTGSVPTICKLLNLTFFSPCKSMFKHAVKFS